MPRGTAGRLQEKVRPRADSPLRVGAWSSQGMVLPPDAAGRLLAGAAWSWRVTSPGRQGRPWALLRCLGWSGGMLRHHRSGLQGLCASGRVGCPQVASQVRTGDDLRWALRPWAATGPRGACLDKPVGIWAASRLEDASGALPISHATNIDATTAEEREMTEDLASLPADWGAGVSPRGLAVTQAGNVDRSAVP